MAEITIPRGNPITFYEANKVDYRRYYPNYTNSDFSFYVPGIYLNCYVQPFVIGQELNFQLRCTTEPVVTLHDIKTGSEEVLTGAAFNPTGWTLTNIWKWEKTLTIESEYYLTAVSGTNKLKSSPFWVSYQNKNVARLEYSSSKNVVDRGLIFTQNETDYETFSILVDGHLDTNANGLELESYETDNAGLSIQNSTPIYARIFDIGAIPDFMVNLLTEIIGFNSIKINGLYYQIKEYSTAERIDRANMYTMKLTMQLVDENAGVISDDNLVITDDSDLGVTDDSEVAVTDGI